MGVLILLPPSETKTPVRRGKPLDPAGLSFPPLAPTRAAVLDALIEVSAAPDATHRLFVPASLTDVVRRNVALRDAPSAAAEVVYSGVLYDALGLADLDPASRRRARAWIVVISALWGAVRLGDRIPPYRLNMCGRLPGLAHLTDVWRGPLADVLPAAARRGIVVDCRSAEYATAWRPTGALVERTVVVKVFRGLDGERAAVSHNAKHTRGLVVRRIVTDAVDPRRPEGLAEALSEHFEVDLRRPDRPGRTWELHVVEPRAR
ncbi:MAG TPA: peroxide stress protein YaaA [Ilumatobacteraceae bacterium]|nr:peroxide stress protein YaaA [Ilumatobacteraceae bacterium]